MQLLSCPRSPDLVNVGLQSCTKHLLYLRVILKEIFILLFQETVISYEWGAQSCLEWLMGDWLLTFINS